jgi:hypothetical protein
LPLASLTPPCAGDAATAALLAVLAVAFSPLLRGPRAFVPWDDPENFEQAHGWKGLRWRNVRWAFTAQQCVRCARATPAARPR